MIPESFIQELLNRVDVVDIIDKKIQLPAALATCHALNQAEWQGNSL